MNVVTGRLRRKIGPLSFTDITDAVVLDIAPVGTETAVTFDAELTVEQVAAVGYRMDSTDADDEADRATTRVLRAQLLDLRDAETLAEIVTLLPTLVDAAVAGLNYKLDE